MLLVHPAGAGHGLNLQDGGHIIVWFSPTYDQELNEQLIDRLNRQGQQETVSVIWLIAEGTMDEDARRSTQAKANSQDAMMEAVKDAIASVPDGRLRMLLRYRYVDGMTWERIAVNMNLDARWVRRLHGRALDALTLESPP